MISRRNVLRNFGLGAGSILLSGCDRLDRSDTFNGLLRSAEGLTMRSQRLLTNRTALAREFTEAEMSPIFRMNGTRMPDNPAYQAMIPNGFADWRLEINGLVQKPLSLSLAQLRSLPTRTQITRHDCVEGWSAIGKWHGVPLKLLLDAAGLRQAARFIVFHCADSIGNGPYYESIDIIDAFHPQTILAWGMSGQMLPVGHGAPLRLRVERQLGYKHAKYVMRVEAVDSLAHVYGGKGGSWEDRAGYEWYAGI
jgi:DMSO/TMAO reductase YedYZ molybdopterin-dependent catalytic subunit